MIADPPHSALPSAVPGAEYIEHIVSGLATPMRLVDYMKARLTLVPVTEVGDLITSGFVAVTCSGQRRTGRTTDPLASHDRIDINSAALGSLLERGRWNPPWSPPWAPAIRLVHEDDDILVVDKPGCLHVHPLGDRREHTLVNALVHHAGGRAEHPWASWRPHVVQRLDFVVSGLLVVAKNAHAKDMLVRAHKRHELQRVYHAMVAGEVAGEDGVIDAPLGREPGRGYRRATVPVQDGGQAAVTKWRVLARFGDRTRLEVLPQTGRTHQIRAHLAGIGHPIVGDTLYASSFEPSRIGDAPSLAAAAIALHSTHLRLAHPRSAAELEFYSEPPFAREDAPSE